MIRKIPKRIIIDFDGTICKDEFPDVGSPEPNVREALQQLKDLGYEIMIHSCRTASYWEDREKHLKIITEFMKKNEIPYDGIVIDKNLDKPLAMFYIDDRAIRYDGGWLDVVRMIEKLRKE